MDFNIGSYHDTVLYDVMHSEDCHLILGKVWHFDRHALHDGRKNTSIIDKDGEEFVLIPL